MHRSPHNEPTASVLEEKLRLILGYIEQLEQDAAHPETATEFDDWENPDGSAD